MNRRQRRAQGKAGRTPASVAPADPVALHEAGIQAYRAGDLGRAAALIADAIAIQGGIPSFHYNLGIVLKALGRLEEAGASYQRAVMLKPDYVDAHNNLGNVLKAQGRREHARASFQRALQYNPGNADTHYNLGVLACELGRREEAVTHFHACLAGDPDDKRGARILLAHLGASQTPERASQVQMLGIYDVRARFWDQERFYFGATLVAGALRRHAGSPRLDILDIGCGTGLVGAHVRDLAGRLDGVDLSPAMLERAKAKGVYDQLFQADLVAFLSGRENSCDAILAAAILIHFGELKALFQASSASLRDGGLFVFTVFPLEDRQTDYAAAATTALAQSGCFRHNPAYLERLAGETGFSVLELEKIVHEQDADGNPVSGILAVLRRQAR